jgi:hypothetical protein
MKSFYDLDYIIEINEKRIEELSSNYQKVLERITNIILIYSALAIFIIPLIQDFCWKEIRHWVFIFSFILFAILFITSLLYTVRLLIPVQISYLDPPHKYYNEFRDRYEKTINDFKQIPDLLKASYITELETVLTYNISVFRRKNSFYYNSLIYALLSAIPYLVCLGFHISKKQDQIHKVEIVGSNKKN